MSVFHAIKRVTIGGIQARHEEESEELRDGRQRLEHVEKALAKALTHVEKSHGLWSGIAHNAQNFTDGLQSFYPGTDALRDLFKSTLERTTALEREVVDAVDDSKATDEAHGASILRMVRGYIQEIRDLKGEYGKVEAARKEYGMVARKMSKLEKKSASAEKKGKFEGRLESTKATYDSVLEGVLQRVNVANGKAPSMFKGVYVVYWLSVKQCSAIISNQSSMPVGYATANDNSVFGLTQSASQKGK